MIQIKKIRYIPSVDNFTDVIINLEWEYSLEGFQSISGTLELPLPTDEFIPISELQESVMITWVERFVNPVSYSLQPIEINDNEIKEITL